MTKVIHQLRAHFNLRVNGFSKLASVSASNIKAPIRSGMRVEQQASLNPLSCKEWTSLFPDHPDAGEMINLMGASGMDGFEFSSIVIRDDQGPVLLLPLFITHYDLL